jgi:hypothetical protein
MDFCCCHRWQRVNALHGTQLRLEKIFEVFFKSCRARKVSIFPMFFRVYDLRHKSPQAAQSE